MLRDAVVEGEKDVTLVLVPQREVFQSLDVGEAPSPVDPAITARSERLSGTEINDVPYPASHSLRNSFKLMPGVVQDNSGAVHFHGGAEYQTQYLLDGFDISNPIGGRFETPIAVEGVRSVELLSSRESARYGRGSAGALAIDPGKRHRPVSCHGDEFRSGPEHAARFGGGRLDSARRLFGSVVERAGVVFG